MLTVARRNPDGFRLLWVHARREPRSPTTRAEVRAVQVAFAEELAGPNAPAPSRCTAGGRLHGDGDVESVLAGSSTATRPHDDDFVALATDGLRGHVSWPGPAATGAGAGDRVTTAAAGSTASASRLSSESQSAGAARGSTTNFDAPTAM